MATIEKLLSHWGEGCSKRLFNDALVEYFEHNPEVGRDIDVCVEKLHEAGIKLKRRQVIGKLSICGVKNIVPKVDKPKVKKDTGPTKKELISQLVDLLGLSATDLLTFNNVKKSEIAKVIKAVQALTDD